MCQKNEKGLNKIDGVLDANVNFAIEKTKVVYDLGKTNVRDFEDKIEVQDKQTFDISGMVYFCEHYTLPQYNVCN